jgi:hypothetical protein
LATAEVHVPEIPVCIQARRASLFNKSCIVHQTCPSKRKLQKAKDEEFYEERFSAR